MSLDDMIKLCEERLGQRVRWHKPNSKTITEGRVELWVIQRREGKDPEPYLMLEDTYTPVSLYQTEPLEP